MIRSEQSEGDKKRESAHAAIVTQGFGKELTRQMSQTVKAATRRTCWCCADPDRLGNVRSVYHDDEMAYDERFADRLRGLFDPALPVVEKRMFGGLAFLVGGHMCAGVVKSDLMLRVGADSYEEYLQLPNARRMDFTGRPMKGFLYVGNTAKQTDAELKAWLERGLRFIATLPPK